MAVRRIKNAPKSYASTEVDEEEATEMEKVLGEEVYNPSVKRIRRRSSLSSEGLHEDESPDIVVQS